MIGFAATRVVSEDEIELAGIVVRRAWAGRGIGRRLVRQVLDLSHRTGARSVVVRTEVDNVAAIGFYESLGFRVAAAPRLATPRWRHPTIGTHGDPLDLAGDHAARHRTTARTGAHVR